jgi:hypothetical protein
MRQIILILGGFLMTASLFYSCQEDNSAVADKLISKKVLDRLWEMGFSNENVQKVDEGYLVEGDIIVTEENLQDQNEYITLRIAGTEQYRTTNLVTGLPRVITVSMDNQLTGTTGYPAALTEALLRYNSQNLLVTFLHVGTSGGEIHLKKQPGNYLASAGFPSGGDPYHQVKLNSNAIGSGSSNTFINYCATIMAHEMGHCIGMRHTDWMDRSYSCGGPPSNEGQSGVGAIQIPGTPSGPDAGSWMLSCISNNQNRPFNNNDKTALNYLY